MKLQLILLDDLFYRGTATIKPVEGSNYTFDEFNEFFTIKKYEIKDTDVFLDYKSVVADGNQKKPGVTVKMGNNVIGSNEYNVSYGTNINVGEGTVTVEIKSDSDNYEGTVTKTFQIVNKQELTISGIESQEVIYTGYDVQLSGTLTVSNNIPVSSIIVTWYKDGVELSSVPKNAGVYKVVYSYEDSTYIGRKEITVTVKKKTSTVPTFNLLEGVVNNKLSSITLPNGFKWVDENETILAGNNTYTAKYTTNNDTTNYTTESISISVYGKSKVNLNTTVNGTGGTISSGKLNVLEGTTETIIFTPNTGYEIDTVTVNGVDKTSSLINNKLDIVIGTNDINVEVKFKPIKFTITVSDVENVMISPVGVSTVNYNDSKDIIIIPDVGYNLVSVKVNGVEKVTEISNDKLTLSNITEDINIIIVVERNIYNVIEGGNQKYTISKDTDSTFRIDADYSTFIDGGKVYVDGELVDSKNYTSKSGSTIITLKKDFISTLSVGEHSLKVLFSNGEANTKFTVVKLDNTSTGTIDVNKENKESSPKTGDSIGFYITAGILSISLFTGLCIYKRKENN